MNYFDVLLGVNVVDRLVNVDYTMMPLMVVMVIGMVVMMMGLWWNICICTVLLMKDLPDFYVEVEQRKILVLVLLKDIEAVLWLLVWRCSVMVVVVMECSVEVVEVKWWNCEGMEVDGGWCCGVVDWPQWR